MMSIAEYDQYQYYPGHNNQLVMESNHYDNQRQEKKYIDKASIQSNVISGSFVQLFLRYDPRDNSKIQSNCSDFAPLKQQGFNWRFKIEARKNGFNIEGQNFQDEDKQKLMKCIRSLYLITLNDSPIESNFYFYNHPTKNQKGLVTMLNISDLPKGENIIDIKKISTSAEGEIESEDFTTIPFWLE